MRKKSKYIIKSDSSGRTAKVYINKKWLKDVCNVTISVESDGVHISVTTIKRNKYGVPYVDESGEELARETKFYRFGR